MAKELKCSCDAVRAQIHRFVVGRGFPGGQNVPYWRLECGLISCARILPGLMILRWIGGCSKVDAVWRKFEVMEK